MNNTEFYNSFAKDYNTMIPLKKQVKSKANFFRQFIGDSTRTAADIGAGSGADSIALSELGVNVSAFEPSTEMLNEAKLNFHNSNVDVDLLNKKVSEIDTSFDNSYDLIVSMGNTFANIKDTEIEQSIAKVCSMLKPEAKAIIQLLNYTKVLNEKERIVNITGSKEKQFIRFYDFCGNDLYFNILSYSKDDFSNREIITTQIYPYTSKFMRELLLKQELEKVEFYGDMKLNRFEESNSTDLIIIIKK